MHEPPHVHVNEGSPQPSVVRLMPKEEMRDARVDGFMPSNLAAPRGPETLPLVCLSEATIASLSCRFNSSRMGSAGAVYPLKCALGFSIVCETGSSNSS